MSLIATTHKFKSNAHDALTDARLQGAGPRAQLHRQASRSR
jgi:hypothetical protein